MRNQGLYRETALYCGIDKGEPIEEEGSLGNQSQTWAVSEQEMREVAAEDDRAGINARNPFYFALAGAAYMPAVAVFDGNSFVHPTDDDGQHEYLWRLAPNVVTMDKATIAVILFTE